MDYGLRTMDYQRFADGILSDLEPAVEVTGQRGLDLTNRPPYGVIPTAGLSKIQ